MTFFVLKKGGVSCSNCMEPIVLSDLDAPEGTVECFVKCKECGTNSEIIMRVTSLPMEVKIK